MRLKTNRADGTEIELELTPEQEKAMEVTEVKKNMNRWRAEIRSDYWYVDSFWDYCLTSDWFGTTDNYHYNSGNYYQTKEQAEFARDKQLAIVKINDRIAELNGLEDWKNWYIEFKDDKLCPDWTHSHYVIRSIFCVMYTREVASQIIEEFRDELMKYIFN